MAPSKFTVLEPLDGSSKTKTELSNPFEQERFFIPSGDVRLLSPQSFFKEHNGGSLHCSSKEVILTLPDDTTMSFPWQPSSNLPYMLTPEFLKRSQQSFSTSYADSPNYLTMFDHRTLSLANSSAPPRPSVLSESNINLFDSQKELLLWHQSLGHASFKRIQQLFVFLETEHTKF
jgi:hypothetical protein